MVWGIILWRTSRWQARNHALEIAVASRTKELHEIIKAFELSDHKLGEQLLFQKKMNNSITHDINTPLKYLMISSRSLVDKISKKELPALEEVRHIYTSSQRIYQYAQNLTGYMKVRLDSKDIVLEECRLHTLVKDKIELFRIAADSAGTTISNKVETHFSLETHAPLLSILLHNLLDNALKNTSAGRIAVYAYAGEDQVSIIVEDTGMGIPWDMLHQYNAFFNAPSSVLKNVYTGFGFEIIRNILPLLKARISITPGASGRGARFEVIIPVP